MLRQFACPLSTAVCSMFRPTSATHLAGQQLVLVATFKRLVPPKKLDDVEFPVERRRLRLLMKAPQPLSGQRMPKMMKRLIDMRGPELIHNKLIHKQYGIRAIMGGQLRHGHNEMMRSRVNRNLDESRMFAVWRIDSPWKPITRKGQVGVAERLLRLRKKKKHKPSNGHRMGGGKGSIDHYTMPVKSGRIILEIAGHCDYDEVFYLLKDIAKKLPFKAEPICQAQIDLEAQNEEYIRQNNVNIFSFERCLKDNFLGSRLWASNYDYMWHGKHR